MISCAFLKCEHALASGIGYPDIVSAENVEVVEPILRRIPLAWAKKMQTPISVRHSPLDI